MNTILLYVIVSIPMAHPSASLALIETRDQQRCEAITLQINAAPSNGNRYECRTYPQYDRGQG